MAGGRWFGSGRASEDSAPSTGQEHQNSQAPSGEPARKRRRLTAAEKVAALEAKEKALRQEMKAARAAAARERRRGDTREKVLAGAALKKLVREGDAGARALLDRVAGVIQDEGVRGRVAAWGSQGDGDA